MNTERKAKSYFTEVEPSEVSRQAANEDFFDLPKNNLELLQIKDLLEVDAILCFGVNHE